MNTNKSTAPQLGLTLLMAISLFSLSACDMGNSNQNTGDRNNPQVETRPDEEVFPTLDLKENGNASKIVLRSQTSHYLNDQKSAVEIEMTSSKIAFCENEEPPLKDKEESIKITIKAKNPKTAITKGEFVGNKDFDITATRKTTAGETTISADQFQSLKITDINNAIVRGNFNVSSTNLALSGEYFTAICK